MAISVLAGALFTVGGFFLTPPVLRAMGTTAEALPGATLYLQIYFLGMIPNLVYNMAPACSGHRGFQPAAVLPHRRLPVQHRVGPGPGAGAGHGGAGVAIATVASQVLSAALVLLSLTRADGQPYQLFLRSCALTAGALAPRSGWGVPGGHAVGDVQRVQYCDPVLHQLLRTDTVAAWSAYGKMD